MISRVGAILALVFVIAYPFRDAGSQPTGIVVSCSARHELSPSRVGHNLYPSNCSASPNALGVGMKRVNTVPKGYVFLLTDVFVSVEYEDDGPVDFNFHIGSGLNIPFDSEGAEHFSFRSSPEFWEGGQRIGYRATNISATKKVFFWVVLTGTLKKAPPSASL